MVPGQRGTKIPYGVQHGKKKKKRERERNKRKKKNTGENGIIGGRPLIMWVKDIYQVKDAGK